MNRYTLTILGGSGHKSMLAETKLCLLRQNIFVATKNVFVATSILSSRQKTCFVATNTCLSQGFVATKTPLVAAPANDSLLPS